MYFKIVGTEARSLKELWKWLKQVVSQHSSLKKWGQRIAQLTEQDLVGSAKEIID